LGGVGNFKQFKSSNEHFLEAVLRQFSKRLAQIRPNSQFVFEHPTAISNHLAENPSALGKFFA
jgi:hypothetical protein